MATTRSRRTGSSGESGATSLGPHSEVLKENTEELVAYWHARGVDPTPDLVTTSGSGYDPDITRAGRHQPRSRWSPPQPASSAASLRIAHPAGRTTGAELGFLGSSYIDVLQLNEALAQMK